MALLGKDFLARLEALELTSRRIRRGAFRGERRSAKRGMSVEFADHRPYGAGDDLRFLDWSLYARLGTLMTKLYHDEEDLAVHLLLDRSASMEFGDPPKTLHAKRILAALGYVALLSQNRVSFFSPGPDGDSDLRDLRGARNAERLFRAIEDAAPVPFAVAGGSHAAPGMDAPGALLGEPLRRWVAARRPRGVVIVASDLLHRDGAWEHLRPVVRGGIEIHCLRIVSPEEAEPPHEGDLRFVDAEDASGIDVTVTPRLLEIYQRARAEYDRKLDEFCRSRQISLVPTRTDSPVEQLILDVLRGKGLLA